MITPGSIDFAPNRVKLSRVCKDSTTPVAAPASAASGSDFEPIASIWRINSRPSKGSMKATRATRPQKEPNSPNHSKKPTIAFLAAGRKPPEAAARIIVATH